VAAAPILAVLGPLSVAMPALASSAAPAASIWYVAPGGAAGPYQAAAAVDLIAVTKNLTLTGAGAASTVLNGNQLGTVVTVDAGVTATITGVTIEGGIGTAMTIQGTPSVAGGGVLNQGTLTLGHDTLTGNDVTATAAGANSAAALGGGGFNADGGTLSVSHSVISGNSVSYTTIKGNTATAASTGVGGSGGGAVVGAGVGELWSPGLPDLAHDTITGNTGLATAGANAGGSGVTGAGVGEADSDTADAVSQSTDADAITGSMISGNTATARSSGSGGAAAVGAGVGGAGSDTANAISQSTISGNITKAVNTGTGNAGVGGAIAALISPIVTSTIDGNQANATASGTNPDGPVQVNAVGGGLTVAANDNAGSTASPVDADTFASNKAIATYTGSGAGLAQAAGGGIGGSTAVANSTVNNNSAFAVGSGTGVQTTGFSGPLPDFRLYRWRGHRHDDRADQQHHGVRERGQFQQHRRRGSPGPGRRCRPGQQPGQCHHRDQPGHRGRCEWRPGAGRRRGLLDAHDQHHRRR
jgi:hypothetical protein